MKKIALLIIGIIIGASAVLGVLFIPPLLNQLFGGTRYSHTIIIDGVNDFNNNENFTTTSSPDYEGYIAWDPNYIYIGLHGSDFAASNINKWVLIYIGNGGTGTTNGQAFGTQTPTLPFSATHYVRWRLDYYDLNAFEWTGSWTNASWDFAGDSYTNDTLEFFEIRIPLVDIGSPSLVSVHVSMVDETTLAEITYSGVPSSSFSDGYDPDYTKYFQFDLDGILAPADYTPI